MLKTILLLALTLPLVACNGGGGGGENKLADSGDKTPVVPPVEETRTYTPSGFTFPRYLEDDPLTETVTVSATDFTECRDSDDQVVDKSYCEMPSPSPTHEMFVYVLENQGSTEFSDYTVKYFQNKTEDMGEVILVTLPNIPAGEKVYGLLSNSLYHVDFVDQNTDECLLTEVRALPSTPMALSGSFENCVGLTAIPANVIVEGDFDYAFAGTSMNDPNISSWDVSGVTNLEGVFKDNAAFNQPLNDWDVSKSTNFMAMFHGTPFNQPLDNWDVSSGEDFSWMFFNATNFNQDISNWNVSASAVATDFSVGSALSPENLPLLP